MFFSILTGCYDNTIHIWDVQGEHILSLPSHTSPVKCVAWVNEGLYDYIVIRVMCKKSNFVYACLQWVDDQLSS